MGILFSELESADVSVHRNISTISHARWQYSQASQFRRDLTAWRVWSGWGVSEALEAFVTTLAIVMHPTPKDPPDTQTE